jgi:hypothetical protein
MDLKQPSRWETIGLGTLAAVIGFYLVLAALSLLPASGEPNARCGSCLPLAFVFCSAGCGS